MEEIVGLKNRESISETNGEVLTALVRYMTNFGGTEDHFKVLRSGLRRLHGNLVCELAKKAVGPICDLIDTKVELAVDFVTPHDEFTTTVGNKRPWVNIDRWPKVSNPKALPKLIPLPKYQIKHGERPASYSDGMQWLVEHASFRELVAYIGWLQEQGLHKKIFSCRIWALGFPNSWREFDNPGTSGPWEAVCPVAVFGKPKDKLTGFEGEEPLIEFVPLSQVSAMTFKPYDFFLTRVYPKSPSKEAKVN
jgi:hypothetical protein